MELRLLRELEGTQGNLTRLEHTTIESLKNENQVVVVMHVVNML